MKKIFTLIFATFFSFLLVSNLEAQCPAGTSASELNWDNLDFLPSNNTRYSSFYPSAAFPYTQNFAMGTRTVNMAMAPQADIILNGENAVNTAHALSPAVTAGEDVQFTTSSVSNTTITISFDLEVRNVLFSLFDLDNGQQVTITATNAGGVAQTVVLTAANAGSGITLSGVPASPVATAPAANYGDNDTNGALNVSIGGPVKQLIITLSTTVGDIWLSDIDACVTGSFPIDYQKVSRPFTGQSQYVLTVVNNNIYYVDPANGQAYFLFNEPAHNRLNSMAYDPYRRVVYYTFSLTGGSSPQSDKTLRKYDVDSKTISICIPNVNTFGIPTYESGVESGAATFYNGSLYLGVEGYTGTSGGGSYAASRKSTIWKIDFDAAGNPIAPASQVWGVQADDGVNSQNIHDWSDFGISNGMLYDFDGSQSGQIDYYHFNMMTGTNANYDPADGIVPRQVSIGWDEKLYNVDASLGLYNGTDRTGTRFTISAPIGPVIPTGSGASWGDAAGPYRPFLDFGDAPATYDPDPLSPACHDTLTRNSFGRRTKMILGPNEDVEWLKKGFTTIEDNYEDGVAFVPIYSASTGTYLVRVTALNNTGVAAQICAWLDCNGNGVFDAAEGIVPVTVASSAAVQTFDLTWSGLPDLLPNGAYTYLRIRITTATFNMTQANATGYYSTGEVEDYRVVVANMVLPVDLLSFDVKAMDRKAVNIKWRASEDLGFDGYEIQRSNNRTDWEAVSYVQATRIAGIKQYEYTDNNAYSGRSWYRLQLKEKRGASKFSEIRMVQITGLSEMVNIGPNPASNNLLLTVQNSNQEMVAQISIAGITGNRLYTEKITLAAGVNSISIPLEAAWPSGSYIIQVMTAGEKAHKKFVIRH